MIRMVCCLGCIVFQSLCFAQDDNAELVVQKTQLRVVNQKLIRQNSYEIKIHNRAGEKYATIQIPYTKLDKLDNIEAYIKDSNGNIIRKLKKSEIVTKSAIADISFYEDDFVKEFTLKHNVYPYTIVYAYQVQETEFLYLDYWVPVLDTDIPTRAASLTLSVPVNYAIAYRERYVEPCQTDTLNGVINYRWNTSYMRRIEREVFAPSLTELLPSVAIVPIEFTYAIKGSFRDWRSYGNWQIELLKGLNVLPDSEKMRINTLLSDVTGDHEKIRRLYHYLQDETRYINVKIETGGMKPYPADYVVRNKYGDCKALTNYFKSILDYLKIPAYYTKVYAGSPIRMIDRDYPSQQFNHVILYIPLNGQDIWLDCTSKSAFNYLGTFTQNRDALIIDYDNSNFVTTPGLSPEDVLVSRKIWIAYDPLDAKIKLHSTCKGEWYETFLHLDKNLNESEKSRVMRNYLVADGFQLVNYRIVKPQRDAKEIEVYYDATVQNLYRQYGNTIVTGNIPFTLPAFEKPGSRRLPVQMDYPVFAADTLVYGIPEGYVLQNDRYGRSVKSRFGEYQLEVREIDEGITVVKTILLNAGHYTLDEYEEFYTFYKQIIDIENKTHLSFTK